MCFMRYIELYRNSIFAYYCMLCLRKLFFSLRVYNYLLYMDKIFSTNPECLLSRCEETSTCFTEAARWNMQWCR